MNQFLLILRGAPASGKTTIAKSLRSFPEKIVWLKVDNFKEFFTEEASQEEQKYVDEAALATLEYLLESGFSVVMEKIFYDPFIIPPAVAAATKRGIAVKVFELQCSLPTLQERDRNRPGVKEGLRKPLGDQLIEDIYRRLEDTKLENATVINTENLSLEECLNVIKQSLML